MTCYCFTKYFFKSVFYAANRITTFFIPPVGLRAWIICIQDKVPRFICTVLRRAPPPTGARRRAAPATTAPSIRSRPAPTPPEPLRGRRRTGRPSQRGKLPGAKRTDESMTSSRHHASPAGRRQCPSTARSEGQMGLSGIMN